MRDSSGLSEVKSRRIASALSTAATPASDIGIFPSFSLVDFLGIDRVWLMCFNNRTIFHRIEQHEFGVNRCFDQ